MPKPIDARVCDWIKVDAVCTGARRNTDAGRHELGTLRLDVDTTASFRHSPRPCNAVPFYVTAGWLPQRPPPRSKLQRR